MTRSWHAPRWTGRVRERYGRGGEGQGRVSVTSRLVVPENNNPSASSQVWRSIPLPTFTLLPLSQFSPL
jgi:hypothetical protein